MPGIYRPAPPAPQPPAADGVPVGTAKSPIPDLKTPGSKTITAGGMRVGAINVDALRQFLIHRGYDLPHEGGFGPLLKSALADFVNPQHVGGVLEQALKGYRITGTRDTHKWNLANGTKQTKSPVVNGYSPATGTSATNPADPTGSNPIDVSGLTALSPPTSTPLPASLAAKLADLKYGANIKDAEVAVARQPGQAAQDIHDIGHWYGQVTDAQKTAATRDADMSKAGVSSIRDAVSRIVSSLGGSANQGAGLVGAAGENNVGTLQALGTAQDQYNADIAPLLKSEAAGAQTRQTNLNTTNAQDLATKLANLRTQRGDEEASQGMTIRQYNDTQAQRQFQDQLALEQAKEYAALTGAKIIGALKNPKLPKGAFDNSTGSQKITIANGITSALTDDTGKLKSGWDPPRAVAFVNSQLQSAGWNLHNPAVQKYRAGILKTLGLI